MKINESDLSTSFKPKSDRMIFNHVLNQKIFLNKKSPIRNINLKKYPVLNMKYQNKNNFPKLSANYSSSTINPKLKIKYPKIKSAQIIGNKNISFQDEISPLHKKELSIGIFQNNDVDLVRNLNPDSNNDLINNLLFKENLKNKLESKFNFSNYLNQNKKVNEISTEKVSKNENDEEENQLIEKKFSKLKRNNIVEKELNKKLKEIKEDYILKKQDKIKINNKFKQMLKEIDNISYDIEYLEYNSNLNMKRNSKQTNISPNLKSNNTKKSASFSLKNQSENKLEQNKDENTKKRMSVFQNFYKNQKKKDYEKQIKQKRIRELKKELKELKIPLNLINNEIIELRNIEKSTKEKLMKHYLELLYNGKEIRGEGLIWIIKGIWKIGENVPMSFMPTFLDFDAIKYLFNMAKISIELESTKKYIIDTKLKIREKLISNEMPILKLTKESNRENINSGSINTIKNSANNDKDNNNNDINIKDIDNDNRKNNDKGNNLINKINNNNTNTNSTKSEKNPFLYKVNNIFKKKLLNSSSSPNFMNDILKLNKRINLSMSEEEKNEEFKGSVFELSKIFDKKEKNNNLNVTNMPEVREINNLRKKIILLNNKMEEMKKNEIQRIFKEFTHNDYERTYHAPINVVLGALIGEHNRNIQVNNYNIFRKGHLEEINKFRFYDYGKRK